MKRAFFSNLLLLLPLNLFVKVTYLFGIDRTVQNTVGTEAYGRYFTLFSLAMILQIITDFGLAYYNSHKLAGQNERLGKYFPNLLLIKLFLAAMYLCAVLGLGWGLDYAAEDLFMLFFLAFNQVLLSFVLFFRSTIAALGAYRKDSLLSILDKSLLILFGGLLLFSPLSTNFQLLWFVYAQTLSLLLTLLIAWRILHPALENTKWQLRKNFALAIFKRSMPYALTVLLMALYTRSDVIMLERLLPKGADEAGIYAGGYRLLDAANMMGFLLAGLLLPMFSRLLGEKKDIRPLFDLAIRLAAVAALTIGTTAFAFRAEITELLYREATPYWGRVLGWLMLTFIATSLSYVYGPLITAGDMISRLNRYYAYSILLNIALNFLLIFRFGAAGAAFTTLLTQSFVLSIQARICGKRWTELLRPNQLTYLLVYGLLAALTAAAFQHWYSLPWIAALCLSLTTQIGWAFALRLLSKQELLSLLQKEKN